MARDTVSAVGPPEFSIRTTAGVERTGSATDRNARRNPRDERRNQQDRRDHDPPNPQRRRLYDLLFEEVDQFDGLDIPQKARLKANLRAHLTAETARPRKAAPPPYARADQDEVAVAAALLADPAAPVPVDEDGIVRAALTPSAPPEDGSALENALLARQLRECLARNSERARKVAVYLHLLLTIDGALKPHVVVEI